MLKPYSPHDLASQHTLNILGDIRLPLLRWFLAAKTTGDVLLCLTPFSGTWKPQSPLRSVHMCSQTVSIAAQSLVVALCTCIQHFGLPRGLTANGSPSVSLCFSVQSWGAGCHTKSLQSRLFTS